MKTLTDLCTEYRDILEDYADSLTGDFRRKREKEAPVRIILAPPSQSGGAYRPRPEGNSEVSPAAVSAAAVSRAGPRDREERLRLLSALAEEIKTCSRCTLAEKRTHAVPGEGVLDPLVMVIGEAPGEEEDRKGRPFVGRAGQYLDSWLEGTGKIDGVPLSRETNAYIANIVKCRPPANRDPGPEECSLCMGYLLRQIEIVRPRAILALGRVAAQNLLETSHGIGQLRGRPAVWQGLPFLATYHPSAVLRDEGLKRPVWEDLKKLKTLTGGKPGGEK